MSKYALMLATALLLSQPAPPVRAQAPAKPDGAVAANVSESVNHVTGFTAWDDDFLYVAVQVNKPALSGQKRPAVLQSAGRRRHRDRHTDRQ